MNKLSALLDIAYDIAIQTLNNIGDYKWRSLETPLFFWDDNNNQIVKIVKYDYINLLCEDLDSGMNFSVGFGEVPKYIVCAVAEYHSANQ